MNTSRVRTQTRIRAIRRMTACHCVERSPAQSNGCSEIQPADQERTKSLSRVATGKWGTFLAAAFAGLGVSRRD